MSVVFPPRPDHEVAWRLVFEGGRYSDLPLLSASVDLDRPRARMQFEKLLDEHGALSSGSLRLEHRKGEGEFFYDGDFYQAFGTYQMFINYMVWAMLEAPAAWLVHTGHKTAGSRELPRRLRVVYEDFKYPSEADGGRVADRMRLGFVAPRAVFEDLDEQTYPIRGTVDLLDGDVLEIPVEQPSGLPFPALRMHPIIEVRSDTPIKSFGLFNLASTADYPGFGQQLEIDLFDYFPQDLVLIDPYTTPGGNITVGGVDRRRSLKANNGFPLLYAGRNRWQIRSPDGPVQVRVRYRRVFVR